MTFASPSPFGPSAMLLSFKTFETETFGTDVRLLFPRADHLLCPASSLFRVYVRPLKLLFAREPRSYSRRHRSRVVSFRLRLQSFIFASAKFSAYPLVIRRGMQRGRHLVLYPSRCLEPSSLSARPFGVGFHSNRPSIDPSVGSPPSLRGHSTGALSLCIPAKP